MANGVLQLAYDYYAGKEGTIAIDENTIQVTELGGGGEPIVYRKGTNSNTYYGASWEENPFLIFDIEDFLQIHNLAATSEQTSVVYCKLMVDIDFNDSKKTKLGFNSSFSTVSDSERVFVILQGNNKVLKNLVVRDLEQYRLFNFLEVYDLTIQNCILFRSQGIFKARGNGGTYAGIIYGSGDLRPLTFSNVKMGIYIFDASLNLLFTGSTFSQEGKDVIFEDCSINIKGRVIYEDPWVEFLYGNFKRTHINLDLFYNAGIRYGIYFYPATQMHDSYVTGKITALSMFVENYTSWYIFGSPSNGSVKYIDLYDCYFAISFSTLDNTTVPNFSIEASGGPKGLVLVGGGEKFFPYANTWDGEDKYHSLIPNNIKILTDSELRNPEQLLSKYGFPVFVPIEE